MLRSLDPDEHVLADMLHSAGLEIPSWFEGWNLFLWECGRHQGNSEFLELREKVRQKIYGPFCPIKVGAQLNNKNPTQYRIEDDEWYAAHAIFQHLELLRLVKKHSLEETNLVRTTLRGRRRVRRKNFYEFIRPMLIESTFKFDRSNQIDPNTSMTFRASEKNVALRRAVFMTRSFRVTPSASTFSTETTINVTKTLRVESLGHFLKEQEKKDAKRK